MGLRLVEKDEWLEPVAGVLERRYESYERLLAGYVSHGGLEEEARYYEFSGLNFSKDEDVWIFRDWLPGAREVFLVGDFNGWDGGSHRLEKDEAGVWEIRLGADVLGHGQLFKMRVIGEDGSDRLRIPACARRVVQDEGTKDFAAQVWAPEDEYEWKEDFVRAEGSAPRIYEAHIGMAGEEGRVHSYREFAEKMIPRIKDLGYNTIQLMAVAEHPYYGSFGYHVSSFFAPSSRFGTPEDLKYLVDVAHAAGLAVLMDIVHSHAVKNYAEGLNNLDGSGHLYFHPGELGDHPQWDSKIFDYGRPEVRRFLLSNVRYWLKEFRFDGFRFDGITSMLYWHRGTEDFGSRDSYFGAGVDEDAVVYLMLANTLIHELKGNPVVVAEDMSGMPGLCQPVADGGVGFTHRLAMGIPDFWIKLLKEKRDEDWDLDQLWSVLTNRNWLEKNIAYAESHDQALVGDKTLAFRLMDAEMYWNMARDQDHPVVERGIALHKLIRLMTFFLGGEGWLNFMGNEFGHPEWVDFPREGNGWNYDHCRRQWSLVERDDLRYADLNSFDRALQELDEGHAVLNALHARKLFIHNNQKVMVAERNHLILAVNLNSAESYADFEIPVPANGTYRVVLDTDASEFGGHGRIAGGVDYRAESYVMKVYLPNRTGLVFGLVEE